MARKVVIVTGANRGIGLAICEEILLNHNPVKLYACSRAGKDLGLKYDSSLSEVRYPRLDIAESSQVQDLAHSVGSQDGHIDTLINNAGRQESKPGDPKDAEGVIHVNYRGTLELCRACLPLMTKNGRIVNVSSVGGLLHRYSQEIQDQFRSPNLTTRDIDGLAEDYLHAITTGDKSGWGRATPYSVSKSCVTAMTAVLARENGNVFINSCCPGWVATDMGAMIGRPPKSPAEGARIPVRLGFDDIQGVTGRYWSNPNVADTGDGQVTSW